MQNMFVSISQRLKNVPKKRWLEIGFVASLTVLHFINWLVFYLFVNARGIFMGFFDEFTGEFTTRYFEVFFTELTSKSSELSISIRNTFITFGVQNFIVFPAALLFSYFLYKKIWAYKYFRIVFFLPNIISQVVLVTLFRYIMNGPIADILQDWMGLSAPPLLLNSEQYAMKSIMIYIVWVSLGSNMVILGGTFSRIPAELVDSCKLDGAGFFKELWHISIPLIWPTLSTMILLNFVSLLGASGPVLLFTNGGYGTSTISFWMYSKTVVVPNHYYASAVGIVFSCVAVPLSFGVKALTDKIGTEVEF